MKESGAARPVGVGAHLEKNRRTRDWRGKPSAECAKLIKEADPDVVESGSGWALRFGRTTHHLHWRILQACREAYLAKARVSEDPARSSTRVSTETHAARRHHEGEEVDESPSRRSFAKRCPKQFWQVEPSRKRSPKRSLDPDTAPRRVHDRMLYSSGVPETCRFATGDWVAVIT